MAESRPKNLRRIGWTARDRDGWMPGIWSDTQREARERWIFPNGIEAVHAKHYGRRIVPVYIEDTRGSK